MVTKRDEHLLNLWISHTVLLAEHTDENGKIDLTLKIELRLRRDHAPTRKQVLVIMASSIMMCFCGHDERWILSPYAVSVRFKLTLDACYYDACMRLMYVVTTFQ